MVTRPRSLLFFGITLVLAAGFVRLGFWQLSRLAERRAGDRQALLQRDLPAYSWDEPTSASPAELNNRRITITGRFDHAGEVVLRSQTEGGVPGVRIVTPLRPLRGDTAILVQRGFVPSPDAVTVDLTPLREAGVRTVTGVAVELKPTEEGGLLERSGEVSWRRVDLAGLRRRVPYPLAGVLVLQTPDSSLPTFPRRDPPPPLDDGPHLSYAVQWFAFALTAVVVGAIIAFRRPQTTNIF